MKENEQEITKKMNEINILLEKTEKIEKQMKLKKMLVKLFFIVILIALLAKGYFTFKEARDLNHTPIGVENIATEPSSKGLHRYETTVDTTNNKVTIDGDTTVWTKEDIDKYIGTSEYVETEIYELKCTNTAKYPFSFIMPKEITFRRYSVRGETMFTDADIQAYKEMAAKYFTYEKYKRFNYDDKYDYEIQVDTSNRIKDMVL